MFVLMLSIIGACTKEPQDKLLKDIGHDLDINVDAPGDANQSEVHADTPSHDDADAGPLLCPDPVACRDFERLVGCSCVHRLDRRCETQADCRSRELCTEIDDYKVCIYTPREVSFCPGAPGCDGQGDGVLLVGAASKVITPDGFEIPTAEGLNGETINFNPPAREGRWLDCGLDGLCPNDEGYPGPDEGEADGLMQGMWLAGFSIGRPADHCPAQLIGCDRPECCVSKFAHDDLKSQVVVFRHNNTTVAFVALDIIGLFHTDIETIRKALPEELGIDLLVVGSTHNHQAPDTVGQWGPGTPLPSEPGRSPAFIEKMVDQTVAGIIEAVAALEPADVSTTIIQAGTHGLAINDSRPPYIFDDNLPVIHARSKATGQTIATMLSFGNHAEVLWSQNRLITSDYPHFVRKYIEQGLPRIEDDEGNEIKPALPGLGGVTVFFAGAVGGLVNPGAGGAVDYAEEAFGGERRHSFAAADAVGQSLAARVLSAAKAGDLIALESPDLRFARREFLTPIANTTFQLASYELRLIDRDIYNVTRKGNRYFPSHPQVLVEVAAIGLGAVTIFTAPGEVFPETLVGGFPGKARIWDPVVGDIEGRSTPPTCDDQGLPTPNDEGNSPCIVKKSQENPPDWSKAPSGPYVYERVPGEYPFFIGLGMDFLGYMVPAYDYQVTNYFTRPPGSHYEETNGAGPDLIVDWERSLDEVFSALP